MESDRPLDALNNARGKKIMVELKNGKQLIGKLKAFDIHINVVREDVEERVDGQIKRKIGTAFLRGDTIILITPEWSNQLKWEKEHLLKEKKDKPSSTIDVEGAEDLLIIRKNLFAVIVVMEDLKN